jgi:hypothetical protein
MGSPSTSVSATCKTATRGFTFIYVSIYVGKGFNITAKLRFSFVFVSTKSKKISGYGEKNTKPGITCQKSSKLEHKFSHRPIKNTTSKGKAFFIIK